MSTSAFPYGCVSAAEGQGGPAITLTAATATTTVAGGAGFAGFQVNTDGTLDRLQAGAWAQINSGTDWIIPNGSASSEYEVYAELVSQTGGILSGTMDTWLALSVDRQWSFSNSAIATHTCVIRLTIRRGANTLATADFTMTVTRTS